MSTRPAGVSLDVEYWRGKIKLRELLENLVDGRTTSGLEKALVRAESSEKHRLQATLLRNFNKVVKSMKSMAECNLQRVPLSEIEQYMEVVTAEGVALPMVMQRDLLQRRTHELVAECRYKELFQCMNPWEPGVVFDWRFPALAGIEEADALSKLKTFESVIVEQVLLDKIFKGEEGKMHVEHLCQEASVVCGLLMCSCWMRSSPKCTETMSASGSLWPPCWAAPWSSVARILFFGVGGGGWA